MTALHTAKDANNIDSHALHSLLTQPELSEEYLNKRFARPARTADNIQYGMTKDEALIHQYLLLREEMFVKSWGLKSFSGGKDAFDDESDIILATIGKQCIGGCRLTFREPEAGTGLPLENEDFRLSNVFPDLPLNSVRIAEVSRLAILPDYQNSLVMLDLLRELFRFGAKKHARYVFTLSPVPLARSYRKAVAQFGLKWEIMTKVPVPQREEYEGIKMVLCMMDLTPIYKKKIEENQLIGQDLTYSA